MKSAPVILFDGYCHLCSRSVRFVKRHSRPGRFVFLPVSSPETQSLLGGSKLAGPLPDTLILISGEEILFRSRAALRISAQLRFPWNLATVFYLFPRFLRDPLYDLIARNRYRWFGKRESCYLP
ncbi:MAG: thiol-disulfide oxidoreductase DCC family protein [Bacteroidota bacterium]